MKQVSFEGRILLISLHDINTQLKFVIVSWVFSNSSQKVHEKIAKHSMTCSAPFNKML